MISLKSPNAIAKTVGTNFRQVLSLNPQAIPFQLPPQVSMGLQVANSLGLKVPTPDDLKKLATGQIDLILKGARREVLDSLAKAQSGIFQGKSVDEVLQSIEWLL